MPHGGGMRSCAQQERREEEGCDLAEREAWGAWSGVTLRSGEKGQSCVFENEPQEARAA